MPRPRRQTTDEVTEPTPEEGSPEPLEPVEPQPAPKPEDEPTPPEPEAEVQEPERDWKPGDYVRLQYGKGQITGFTVRENDPQKDPETYLKQPGWHVISVGKRQM